MSNTVFNCVETIKAESTPIRAVLPINNNEVLIATANKRVHLVELSNDPTITPTSFTKRYEGNMHEVTDVDYSEAADVVLTAGRDKTVRIYHKTTMDSRIFKTSSQVRCVSVNCEGTKIVYASNDMSITLINTDGVVQRVWNSGIEHFHKGYINDISFIPKNPDLFATVGNDGCLKVWNSETGELEATYFNGSYIDYEKAARDNIKVEDFCAEAAASSLSFSTDGSLVAYGTWEGKVYLVNHSKKDILSTVNMTGKVTALTTSASHPFLAIASPNKIMVWNFLNDSSIGEYVFNSTKKEKNCFSLKFVEGEIVAGLQDGTVLRIEVNTK